MAEPSEEKSQPASQKKLRDARQKGQVAKSQDMVSAMSLLGCTLCLVVLVPRAEAQLRELIDLAALIYVEPFATVWPRLLDSAQQLVLALTLPLFAVTLGTSVLTNVITMGGALFSVEPVKPDFQRINPADGLKRIFSMRNLVEFLKGLFKVVALASAFYVVGRLALQALLSSSACGAGCIEATFHALLTPLVVTVILAFLLVGGLDILMQRWLFGRDMRMTRSEHKRERKDVEGDPLIKRERNRLRQQMQALGTARVGVAQATLMVAGADGWLVGLRYVRGETPVPVVVCRAEGEQARALLAEASALGIAQALNPDLAARIARQARPGDPVPDTTFQEVADLLVAARLI
ncbi:translocation protein in type III secretion system, RhcU [Stutzerimonas nosocomialis]|uniref:EscU/YscU/HrcU family type III secretion system export apparatus switch protein n=1 Tax=Stutzerimonas nosocomialis TaxID=1056496 RepID=UPI001108C47F|nr:EscU/YscU/HrcU family type III secretion system export apparatus switch protein [Stutzerimonas nosocomialis]TLX56885.1 translocation protein in type III secretion system, RhcU [Stutzerimonas nosocomialis]